MATKNAPESKQTGEPDRQQVRFFIKPGTKVEFTIDVGETIVDRKVSLTVQIEQVHGNGFQDAGTAQLADISVRLPRERVSRLKEGFEAIRSRLQILDLATWLFLLSLSVYLVTRLVGLTQFPIYFFTDEAIQTQSIIELIERDYRDPSGALLPTYFRNGEYYNLSTSVYLQWLPAVLFGKSAVATRVISVIVTLLAAVAVGITLRDIFKLKYWWAGVLFLSVTPAWFLHSRTAFETAEFVAFYAGTLCAYLFYRYKSPRSLYLAVFLGALSFYTYSPGQVIMPLTAAGLLLSDWRYHWENRRTVLFGLGLAVVLALPYVRSSVQNPSAPLAHLHTLYSYWFEEIPLTEKLGRYFSEFGLGLSPGYWYLPNDRDLARHLMKGYGHILIATLPFALLGLREALGRLRQSRYRAILVALFVSPAAAALVQVSITRVLVFVIPAAILTTTGFERVMGWIEEPRKRLFEVSAGPRPTFTRIAVASLIFLTGIWLAFLSNRTLDGIVLLALAILLGLKVSGLSYRLARSLTGSLRSSKGSFRKPTQTFLALSAFFLLSGVNVLMLGDALRNGPLWFRDYGLGGMQYGAFQIFDIIEDYLRERPETRIIFSPDWANGTDVVTRFFLSDPDSIQIASVRGHITHKLPLDDNTLFIITPQEFETVMESDRLTDVHVERIVPYPDGAPGFYFVRLRYVENIDEIFAAEIASRHVLQESTVDIGGQPVNLRFTYQDSDFQAESIAAVFDDDPFSVTKTYEINPFLLELTFPAPRTINGFSIIIGSANVRVTLDCYPVPGAQPVTYIFEGQGTRNEPELSFDLPAPIEAQVLHVTVLDLLSDEQAKVHIWELKLR